MPGNMSAAQEKLWDRAKEAAAKSKDKNTDQLKGDDFALVQYIFQKMKKSHGESHQGWDGLGLYESRIRKFIRESAIAPKILDDIDWARKPSDFREVDDIDPAIAREGEFRAFVAKLQVHTDKGLEDTFPTHPQYYILKNKMGSFLVDNQGYDYPRYVVKIK